MSVTEFGIEESDALLLLEYASGTEYSRIRLMRAEPVREEVVTRFTELLNLRKSGIPVQYITGQQNFMGLEFRVSEDVLIPRPETELLTERVLNVCRDKQVLDLCTGSGCIAVAVAKLGDAASVSAADISERALTLAKRNAKEHGVQISFLQGDLLQAADGRKFDIIVSNPPYIPAGEIPGLMREVRDYEPHLALDGGADGLDFYRRIASGVKGYLNPGGKVFLEIGCEQGEAVAGLFREQGFETVNIYKDYSGLDRIVTAE